MGFLVFLFYPSQEKVDELEDLSMGLSETEIKGLFFKRLKGYQYIKRAITKKKIANLKWV